MSSEIINRVGTLFLDQAMAAAKEGDLQKMSQQIELHREAQRGLVPVRTYWINETLAYIAKKFGEEEVFNIWKSWMDSRFEQFNELGAGGQLERLASAHNSLGSIMKNLEEKEDRYVLTLDPCGSGGVMRRENMLKSGQGVTKKGYPWSWGKTGVPYYCVHCAIAGEIVPRERTGKAWWLQEFPDDPQGVCIYNFLKPLFLYGGYSDGSENQNQGSADGFACASGVFVDGVSGPFNGERPRG